MSGLRNSSDDLDDDICGASISLKYNSHLIAIWNRIAPALDKFPPSAMRRGTPPFTEKVEMESPVESARGIEKLKDEILRGVSETLMPQEWYYRV